MRISYDTVQIILIVAVIGFGTWALVNSKEPVKDQYYNDKYDQVNFDSGNPGCVWGLIIMFIGACGVMYGFYCFFEALGK